MPKLKGVTFETAIIERYKRRETSIEEALIEMYLAGVSVRRVEDIAEALWGTKVLPGTISNLNKKAYEHIEAWRNRPLKEEYPYIYVDGIFLKRCWGEEFENVSILVAIGVSSDGYREIIGAAEGLKEDLESWKNFFVWLKQRGLKGVKLVIGDKALGGRLPLAVITNSRSEYIIIGLSIQTPAIIGAPSMSLSHVHTKIFPSQSNISGRTQGTHICAQHPCGHEPCLRLKLFLHHPWFLLLFIASRNFK